MSDEDAARERRARSPKRESAREVYVPERGEVFFEEQPKPFSVSLREILEEYRSDSTPDRYAMAVELEEAPEGEEPLGPAPEESGAPEETLSARAALHAYWDSTGVPRPPEEETPRRYESEQETSRRRQEARPVRQKASVRKPTAVEETGEWSWMDIVNEFKMSGELESSVFEERPRSAAGKRQPMTHRNDLSAQRQAEEQPHIDTPAGGEDALPAGIRPLQGRRSSAAAPSVGHLSFEEIMAEFGGTPVQKAESASEAPAVEAPKPEARPEHRSRRSHMEDEARELFQHLDEAEPVKAEAQSPAEVPVSEPEEAPLRDEDFTVSFPRDAMELGRPAAEQEAGPAPEEAPKPETKSAPEAVKTLLGALPFPKKKAAGRKAKQDTAASRPRDAALDDTAAYPADYAADDDYESEEEPDPNAFPSFGDYLLGLVTGLWLRLRGVAGSERAETM